MSKMKFKITLLFILLMLSIFCSSCIDGRDMEDGFAFYYNSSTDDQSIYDITIAAGVHVVLPSEHNGHPITSLNDTDSTLFELPAIYQTLILPDTLKTINRNFYYGASKFLKYNEYDNGLYLGTKDNPYFAFIKVKEVDYPEEMSYNLGNQIDTNEKDGLPPPLYLPNETDVTTLKLHPDTKIIANEAFAGCKKLKSITIPGTIKRIPVGAFAGCFALEEVIIEEGVEEILGSAFLYCDSLEYLLIPNTIKKAEYFLGKSWNRESMIKIELAYGMEKIPDGMFKECDYLESIVIPNSVKEIGKEAFAFSPSLKSITLSENLEYIGEQAFRECVSLSEIHFPETLKKIDEMAFSSCVSISSIKLPKSLEYIGDHAFSACTSLISLVISENIEYIGSYAFANCGDLNEIFIPKNFTQGSWSIFNGTHTEVLYYDGTLEEWEELCKKNNLYIVYGSVIGLDDIDNENSV